MTGTTDAQKVSVFLAAADEIAKQDETVAAQLKSEYLPLASGSIGQAAWVFLDDWYRLINTYPDVGRLTCYLQHETERKSNWARVFLGNAPLIAQSFCA